ncbi:PHB depolymerase family esterase [Umezawaea sp. Da 62-37]|uniref:extracellular catalytic domain type 1 short-chain-length polyhydroxyalkanoate depolymerase n=1 Tax=Umezawaea sp. Da 62-37 TaxID=3075927 RepID=UPI0028F6D864|nr:PHB depolymerase family esterase [Umezawaea sp. Da 62-37]WNV87103.1 PHB depolymerase family esterase [Umezawaea sp. Da 62-37]
MKVKLSLLLVAVTSLVVGGLAITAPPPASAASLTEITNFGDNPGGMRMHVYAPDSRPANPAIVVAMHGCGGSGPAFYSGSEFASLADRLGYVVIYPSAQQEAGFGKCFDTWSAAAKRRGGGSDPVSIISMVDYVERTYGGDPSRVFATGSSSGGMMTNHMLALYPDVFKAGAAFMGVPFDCFANAADYPPSGKCTGNGGANRTPQQWGDAVRQANPGYTGTRPRIQLWHGTSDTLVPYALLQEAIEQWTDVFGLSQTPTSTDTPRSGWNRRRYTDTSGTTLVEAYSIQGAGHTLPTTGMAAQAVAFFGLDGPGTPTTTTTTTTTTAPPATGACKVSSKVTAWSTGLTESITITNTGSTAINGWSLAFSLPGGQSITSGWSATYSPSSGAVTARNAVYNATIPANRSIDIGFQASHSGNTATPSAFTLNGSACSTA